MVLNFTVDENYGWVLLTCVSAGWLTVWQGYNVGRHRKAAKIPYPQLYAEKSETESSIDAQKFNCAQRAHQNTLENLPQTLFLLTFAGLKHPIVAASLGGVWLLGRVMYTTGYSTGNPKKRTRGFIVSSLSQMGLQILATYLAGRLALATVLQLPIVSS